MAISGKQPLGTILVQAGKIDEDQLQKALQIQKEKKMALLLAIQYIHVESFKCEGCHVMTLTIAFAGKDAGYQNQTCWLWPDLIGAVA